MDDSHRHLFVAAAMFIAGIAKVVSIERGEGGIRTVVAFSVFFLVCVGSLWQYYQTRRRSTSNQSA